MSDERQIARQEQRPVIRAGKRGLVLGTIDDMWRFAQCVAQSGLAPKGLSRPEQVMLAVQAGAELGKGPMWSLQNIVVINGKVGLMGDAALALVLASGKCKRFDTRIEGEGEEQVAITVSERTDGRTVESQFSVNDAKRAGLWGKPGPWTQYPQRMLCYRSRGFNTRDNFPDVTQGFVLQEELIGVSPTPSEAAADVPTREERQANGEPPESKVAAQPEATPGQRLAVAIRDACDTRGWDDMTEAQHEAIVQSLGEAASGSTTTEWAAVQWTDEMCEKAIQHIKESGLDEALAEAEQESAAEADTEASDTTEPQGDLPF